MMSIELIKINDSKNLEFKFLIFKTKTKLQQNNTLEFSMIPHWPLYHLFPTLALLGPNEGRLDTFGTHLVYITIKMTVTTITSSRTTILTAFIKLI